MPKDNQDTIYKDALKIISKNGGILLRLCEDNIPPPVHPNNFWFSSERLNALKNELKENFELFKNKLKEIEVNQYPGSGTTLLGYASHIGWLDAVKYLVEEKKANVNQASSNGQTPLHEAAWRNITVVAYLIEKGANVNQIDNNGQTPLHVAANGLTTFGKRPVGEYSGIGFFRQIDLIQSLLTAGANIQENNKGETPLDRTHADDAPEGLKLFIIPTLLSNPKINKPNSIEKNEKLSAYWDEQVARINFFLEEKKTGTNQDAKKNFLKKITSQENTTLASLAFSSILTENHKVSEAEKTVSRAIRSG